MSVTIHDVCALPDLDLELVAGKEAMNREVRWVHVSEIPDPTPWVQGGELILTTGINTTLETDLVDYVERLAEAHVAGIGLGVGVIYEDVPESMKEAAERNSIALLRIPISTPYMAISEAVSTMLAEDRFDAVSRASDANYRLTRTALGSGQALIRELARQLGGWVIQTDAMGEVTHSWPVAAEKKLRELMPDILRARDSGKGSITASTEKETHIVHPLRAEGPPRGFLVTGFPRAAGIYERSVITTAVALLTLEAEREHTVALRLHKLRAPVLAEAISAQKPSREFHRLVVSWGIDPVSLRVCVLTHDPADQIAPSSGTAGMAASARSQRETDCLATIDALSQRVTDSFANIDAHAAVTVMHTGNNPHVVILLADDDLLLSALRDTLATEESVYLGVGGVIPIGEIRSGYRGALRASLAGRANRRHVTEITQLPVLKLLLGLSSASALYDFASDVLGPLTFDQISDRHRTLKETLGQFIAHNGRINATADALNVHRHTLSGRIERIAHLTGRDPTEAHTRMELWLALLIEDSFELRP